MAVQWPSLLGNANCPAEPFKRTQEAIEWKGKDEENETEGDRGVEASGTRIRKRMGKVRTERSASRRGGNCLKARGER